MTTESAGPRRSGANLVAAGILLSRVAGLVREIVLGIALGRTPVTDAFRLAMRVPNVLQNLLGEGALSASFIPVYARLVEEGEEGKADRLAGTVAGLLSGATALIVALGVLLADPIVRVFSRFESDPELFDLAVTLLRITTIGIGFLVLSAWCLGVLNSHRSFFLPYVAPVLWNGAQIAVLVAVVVLGFDVDDVAVAAAWAVVAGGVAQLAVQLPRVRSLSPHLRFSIRRDADVDDVLSRFVPAVGARGVVQLSSFIDTFLALALVAGGLATYTFALPLYLLPISLFGFSVAAAELAEMSRRSGNEAMVAERVQPALRRVLIPAGFVTAAFVAIGRPIVDALYGWPSRLLDRGLDDPADVTVVALVLSAFAFGLPAAMTARVTQNTLYSLGDVRGPARIAAIRVTISAAVAAVVMLQLDWLFLTGADGMTIERFGDVPHWPPWEGVPEARRIDGSAPPHLGAVGLAVGSVVASWTEWFLLRTRLRRRLDGPIRSGIARAVLGAGLPAAVVMAAVSWLVADVVGLPAPLDGGLAGVAGLGTYAGLLIAQGVRPAFWRSGG